MNIEKLEVGTYKNYKVLCEVLGEPVKKGDSKKAQLKEWSRYFNFEKQGHKIIVTEIYSKPKPKQDGRVTNGQHENSKQALKKHNESIQTFPTGLLETGLGLEKLIELSKKHELTIFELVQKQYELNTVFEIKTQQLLLDLQLFNNYTTQLMLSNENLLQCFNSEVVGCLYGNLYRTTKNKLLKVNGLEQIKMIVDTDGNTYRATNEQIQFIAEYEQIIVDRYNKKSTHQLKTFNDIYSWNFPSDTRLRLQQAKRNIVSCNFEDTFGIAYSFDYGALIYNKSINDIIQDLGLTVDDTLDTQVEELFQESIQQIHELYYDSQVNRINDKFPLQRVRGFGKSPTKRNNKQALILLRYSLAQDLTDNEKKEIGLMLK